ncbi:hypothetical protein PLEOSDRAFT_159643 [Pleurotus ostreatus PC15]|uniref:Uncharacterized protein n=1 Tax=Pleurotus ostreatus (strain PC15) TaxID=1137138 RepID=A0A067NHK0_PLEO1|nr:hypothetical protein PLEOSDRAFT_159643 [Pleurotus ostreatus PC15]
MGFKITEYSLSSSGFSSSLPSHLPSPSSSSIRSNPLILPFPYPLLSDFDYSSHFYDLVMNGDQATIEYVLFMTFEVAEMNRRRSANMGTSAALTQHQSTALITKLSGNHAETVIMKLFPKAIDDAVNGANDDQVPSCKRRTTHEPVVSIANQSRSVPPPQTFPIVKPSPFVQHRGRKVDRLTLAALLAANLHGSTPPFAGHR